jgi:hypothetical protein
MANAISANGAILCMSTGTSHELESYLDRGGSKLDCFSRFQVAYHALRRSGRPEFAYRLAHIMVKKFPSAMLFSAFRPVVLNERNANILFSCL